MALLTRRPPKATLVCSEPSIFTTAADTHHLASQEAPVAADKDVDEVTDLFKGLAKKKKSKKPKEEAAEGEEDGADGDFGGLKKKKKKKTTKVADTDDFDAKLAEAGVGEEGTKESEDAAEEQDGDMDKGTGIWKHDATHSLGYNLLLSRFFNLLQNHHPDLLSSGSKSYKIPPPQCLREGNKKTIFANISDICKRMNRSDEHVMSFLFAELGTNGSVDGSKRLVIKGRFQQKRRFSRLWISSHSPLTLNNVTDVRDRN